MESISASSSTNGNNSELHQTFGTFWETCQQKMEPNFNPTLNNTNIIVTTVILFLIMWSWGKIKNQLKSTFMVYLDILTEKDYQSAESYTELFTYELLRYVTQLINTNGSIISTLTAETRHGPKDYGDAKNEYEETGWSFQLFWLLGFYRTHNFWWRGTPFFIHRTNEQITVITFKWYNNQLKEFLDEVFTIYKQSNKLHKTKLCFLNDNNKWCYSKGNNRTKKLDSVILKEGVKEKLIQDIELFMKSKEWYMEMDIPYKRGYLLYGPPGSGKTSIIRAMAAYFDFGISQLSLSKEGLNDDKLIQVANEVSSFNNILLFEDFDSAFKKDENGEIVTSGKSNVTKKGILNLFDGIASPEGLIIFITTNHLKQLDPALIRPGRVDVQLNIDHPTNGQITALFKRFYQNSCGQDKEDGGEELVEKFVKIVRGINKKVSMAAIQNLFVVYRNDPKKAVENAETYFTEIFKHDEKENINFYS